MVSGFKQPSPQMEAKFLSACLKLICQEGGTRMQLPINEITNYFQKNYDKLDEVNLFRKQFGNAQEAMKYPKQAFYYLDSMIVKTKKKEEVDLLYQKKKISDDDYQLYLKTYEHNQKEMIKTMEINNQNICKNCGQKYPMQVNNKGSCPANEDVHEPTYTYPYTD